MPRIPQVIRLITEKIMEPSSCRRSISKAGSHLQFFLLKVILKAPVIQHKSHPNRMIRSKEHSGNYRRNASWLTSSSEPTKAELLSLAIHLYLQEIQGYPCRRYKVPKLVLLTTRLIGGSWRGRAQ